MTDETPSRSPDLDLIAAATEMRRDDLPVVDPPPIVDAPIPLKRGETCHFRISSKWLERRVQRDGSEQTITVSDGELFISNKRAIFRGEKRSFAMRWAALLGYQVPMNGLLFLQRSNGPPVLLVYNYQAGEEVRAILAAVVGPAAP